MVRHPAISMIFAAALVLVAISLRNTPLLTGVDHFLDDNWYRLFPNEHREDRIVIIEIDDKTLNSYYPQLPIPRDQIALLLEGLFGSDSSIQGPKAVAVDLYFEGPDKFDESADVFLAYALGQHRDRIVCGLSFTEVEFSSQSAASSTDTLLSRFSYSPSGLDVPQSFDATLPPSLFLEQTDYAGHINVYKNKSNTPRELPLFIQFRGATLGALSLETVRCFLAADRHDVLVSGAGLRFNDLVIPTDRRGTLKLRYFRNEPGYQHYSFIDVLEDLKKGRSLREQFRKKIVLIGINSKKYYPKEFSITPDGRERPNVYLHADVISNILQGFHFSDIGLPYEVLFFVLTAALLTALGALRRRTLRLLLSLVIVFGVLAADMLLFTNGVLFPAASALVIVLPLMVQTYYSSFTEQAKIIEDQTREALVLRKREQSLIEIEHEIEVARVIQEHLLPKSIPVVPGFDIYGVNVAAKGVSGDFFDVIPVAEDFVAIAVGDVSGKGISASLLMAASQSILRNETTGVGGNGKPDCSMIASAMNRLLYSVTDTSRFVTMFLAVLDIPRGNLDYVNAGHNMPLLVQSDGHYEMLESDGLILGVVPDYHFTPETIHLEYDAKLVIYTDGVVEAENASREQYGEDRLIRLVSDHRKMSARQLTDSLVSDVVFFQGQEPQYDDITVVVLGTKKRTNENPLK